MSWASPTAGIVEIRLRAVNAHVEAISEVDATHRSAVEARHVISSDGLLNQLEGAALTHHELGST